MSHPGPNVINEVRPLRFLDTQSTTGIILDVADRPFHDQFVTFHHNRLMIVGIAPSHIALHRSSPILSISFSVGKKGRDRQHDAESIRGKRKRGAPVLVDRSVLAEITCEDGRVLPVCCGVRGKLIEVNDRLIETPRLLIDDPLGAGYVAILAPTQFSQDRSVIEVVDDDQPLLNDEICLPDGVMSMIDYFGMQQQRICGSRGCA